jgi:hypothetical protein
MGKAKIFLLTETDEKVFADEAGGHWFTNSTIISVSDGGGGGRGLSLLSTACESNGCYSPFLYVRG